MMQPLSGNITAEGAEWVIRELRELTLISNLNLFRALKPFQLHNFDPPTLKEFESFA